MILDRIRLGPRTGRSIQFLHNKRRGVGARLKVRNKWMIHRVGPRQDTSPQQICPTAQILHGELDHGAAIAPNNEGAVLKIQNMPAGRLACGIEDCRDLFPDR